MPTSPANSLLNALGLAMVATALVCAPASTTHAQTLIEFTTAEGYTNGGLNGQNGWTSAGYTVGDASGAGEVTVGPLTELGKATLNAGWPSADTATGFSLMSTMSFARDNTSTEFRDFYFNQIAFGNNTIRLAIGRKNLSDQYVFNMQTAGGSGLRSSGNIAGTNLGFADAADTLSDNLSFSLSINHVAGSTNWLVSATVKNEDTSAILATWSDVAFTQSLAFSTGVLTPQIMAGRGTNGLSDITIHSLEYNAIPGFGNYWAPTSSGGEGVWSTNNLNWAGSPGVAGASSQATNNEALIFSGAGGEVEISGTVAAAAGLTFSNNGYVLTNGTVNLTGTNAAANNITTGEDVGATIASVLSGSQGMTKSGQGTLTLSGANTHTGGTTLSSGVLRLNHASAAGTGTITQSSGTTLEINTTGTVANQMSLHNISTLQTVTLSGNKTLNNATYNVTNGTTTTESGVLSGSGGITKLGTGTLLVTASNTFTGAVDVQAGLVSLASMTGSAAGATTNVIVATDATLLIAQSGQVNDGAGVTLSGGTIRRASGVNEVFGDLNVSSASFLDFGTGTEGTLAFGTYTASALLTVSNFFAGNELTFGSDLSGSINNTNSFQFDNAFTSSWNQGTSTFTITAIPEASTYATALLLLALLLWPLRRGLFAGRTSHPHSA